MSKTINVQISNEAHGKMIEILDLGQTLMEQLIMDTRMKLGGAYPEGEKVSAASAELFDALRSLLNSPDSFNG